MTRIRRAAAAALGVMVAATPLFAAAPAEEAAPKPRRATGTVVSVDPTARTVVVRPDGGGRGEMTFHLAAGGRVALRRRPVDLAALGAGDRVRVTYGRAEGRNVATRIGVLAPPPRP